MTLRVRLADGLQDLGSYTLSFGAAARVFKWPLKPPVRYTIAVWVIR
jgi:hypothetical protein